MSESGDAKDKARKKAQNYFTQSEQRDKLVKQELEKERAATDAKTAKLRALRLAKEDADRAAEALVPKPAAKAKKKRVTKAGG